MYGGCTKTAIHAPFNTPTTATSTANDIVNTANAYCRRQRKASFSNATTIGVISVYKKIKEMHLIRTESNLFQACTWNDFMISSYKLQRTYNNILASNHHVPPWRNRLARSAVNRKVIVVYIINCDTTSVDKSLQPFKKLSFFL
ncbi:hypothetical protein GQX74_010232 [Glossina fuscipes]|nr:hypothetical protein GQX74_010232 [Glossina fuscipes]